MPVAVVTNSVQDLSDNVMNENKEYQQNSIATCISPVEKVSFSTVYIYIKIKIHFFAPFYCTAIYMENSGVISCCYTGLMQSYPLLPKQ